MLRPVDPAAIALEAPDREAALDAIDARRLRLLAHATGGHLPVEIALEVEALERQRARLLAA